MLLYTEYTMMLCEWDLLLRDTYIATHKFSILTFNGYFTLHECFLVASGADTLTLQTTISRNQMRNCESFYIYSENKCVIFIITQYNFLDSYQLSAYPWACTVCPWELCIP